MSNMIFGIDLGTTNTALSYLYVIDDRANINLVKNRDGKELTPSVVYFPPGDVTTIVGRPALSQHIEDPDKTFRWIKREMGSSVEWEVDTGTRVIKVTPQTISACILKFICEDARNNLELDSPISRAVITVPAYFGDAQKRATLDAAEIAGLEASLIEEPTAAILDYVLTLHQEGRLRNVLSKDRATIAVFDLGGGTFDLSICEVNLSTGKGLPDISVITKDGDPRLGGFDFDLALAEYALNKAILESSSDRNLQALLDSFQEFRYDSIMSDETLQDVIAELIQHAEQTKELLSHHKSVDFKIPRFRNIRSKVRISRSEFEDSIKEYIENIKTVLSRTMMQTADITNGEIDSWSKIDKVILIGGSTRIPAIEHLIQSTFAVTPSHGGDVDWAVARGAAIKGAHDSGLLALGDLKMTTSHDYGILDETGNMSTVIVPKGSTYPNEYSHRFKVPFSLDVNLPLKIGQQYRSSAEEISTKKFHHPFLYTGDQLDISITVDANGMLHFKATEPNSGEHLEESILTDIGMSEQEKKRTAVLLSK